MTPTDVERLRFKALDHEEILIMLRFPRFVGYLIGHRALRDTIRPPHDTHR